LCTSLEQARFALAGAMAEMVSGRTFQCAAEEHLQGSLAALEMQHLLWKSSVHQNVM